MSNLASRLIAELKTEQYATADLPGIGGEFKQSPEDFRVEEVMPYSPCGEGEHVYLKLQRESMTTPQLAKMLAQLFDFPMRDIGWAGMKDKTAVTIQTFSLRLGWHADIDEIRAKLSGLEGVTVLSVEKHRNKIKRGHVRENRFQIIVKGVAGDALTKAEAISAGIKDVGVPNYFGEQRFSRDYSNIAPACEVFAAQKVRGRQDTFMVSVLQAALFNIWLSRRQEAGDLFRIITGDIAQKTDTGGLFDVEDSAVEQARFDSKEIVYTGPIFGFSMRTATEEEGERERDVLNDFGLTGDAFKPVKAPGTRREGIIYPNGLNVEPVDGGIKLSFGLPSGAYATQVLREFMKP